MSANRDIKAFPSEMSLLLALLIGAVIVNSVSIAYSFRSAPDSGRPLQEFTGAFVSYLLPGWITASLINRIRRRNTVPLTDSPFPDAASFVLELANKAPIKVATKLLYGANLGNRAFVAGRHTKPYLAIGPELLALYRGSPEKRAVFEAVIRHEIAHLTSEDLRAYYRVTVLRVCNLYGGVGAINHLAVSSNVPREVVWLGYLRITILVVIIELVARAFLRAREHYADLYAAGSGLDGMVATLATDQSETSRKELRSWRALFARHPSHSKRLAVVLEPARLLALSPTYLFFGATLTGVALLTVEDIVVRVANVNENAFLFESLAIGSLIGAPFTIFVAFGIWRETWHAAWLHRAPRRFAASVVIVSGLLFGSYLAPFTTLTVDETTRSGIPITWTTLIVVPVGIFGLCYWLAALSSRWRSRDPSALRVRRFLQFAVPVAGIVGGWIFAVTWAWCMELKLLSYFCARNTEACALYPPELRLATGMVAYIANPWMSLVITLSVGSLVLVNVVKRVPETLE